MQLSKPQRLHQVRGLRQLVDQGPVLRRPQSVVVEFVELEEVPLEVAEQPVPMKHCQLQVRLQRLEVVEPQVEPE